MFLRLPFEHRARFVVASTFRGQVNHMDVRCKDCGTFIVRDVPRTDVLDFIDVHNVEVTHDHQSR